MKKLLFVFAFLTFFGSLSLNAQLQVQFGAKAGVNIFSLMGEDATIYDNLIGAHFGGLARFSASNVSGALTYVIQPELNYSMQGAKIEDGKISLSYIQLPIMVQRYIAGSGFYVETGPQIGLLLSAKYKLDGESLDIKETTKKFDFGVNFGLGYLLNNGVGINARYGLGLTSISSDGTIRNSGISVGLLYVFGHGGSDY